ncbi:MAG: hypothetical protein D6691_08655 [Candidatus Hydrogenedentota bacterium]|nr:MAG: hypothetical protein D6691_08655 [Candidatus Hydrogenedentota bacterium]GIX45659.1 MAG: hypothetical protein KatS3mg130_2067 [Candidatus Sumerlaea sp.]
MDKCGAFPPLSPRRFAATTTPRILAVVLALLFAINRSFAQSFPDRVTTFTAGLNAGFGAPYFPTNVLGPPNGSLNSEQPNASESDLLSLGIGGSIVLEFVSSIVVDGPGPDLTVFENPFQPIGYPGFVFCETATVAVSQNGSNWVTFPFNFHDPATTAGLYSPSCYEGLAGVHPVFSSPSNGISPFDPNVSGGDSFDLATVGLPWVRFVKVTDTGTTGVAETVAPSGAIVNDPGNAMNAAPTAGFDLDAIAALHSLPATAVREDWMLYE